LIQTRIFCLLTLKRLQPEGGFRMARIETLAKEIISELRRIQNLPAEKIAQEWKSYNNFPLPSMLGRGDGHGTIISPQIDKKILELGKEYLNTNPRLKTRYRNAELEKLIRETLGLAFVKVDFQKSDDENGREIFSDLDEALNHQSKSYEDIEQAFACTLFAKTNIPAFSIGPALFENRLTWLDRKNAEGSIRSIDCRRIKQKWMGHKLKKRKNAKDNYREQAIVEAIGDNHYVCSVVVKGLPPETGHDKALTIARFALTAIALIWDTSSKALDGFNLSYDRTYYLQRTLSFSGGVIRGGGGGYSHNPHGQFIDPKQWSVELQKFQDIFLVCGDVFEYILNPDTHSSTRSKILDTFSHAMMWFYAGCRERDTLIAIVKYAACLDALACGRKAGGIQSLTTKQMGVERNKTLFKHDPRTMKQVVEEIYDAGRSRTIHGTNDRLGHDWSTTRTQAEVLARHCLVLCLEKAANNPSMSDPKEFFN
jgi:hypothetical protein